MLKIVFNLYLTSSDVRFFFFFFYLNQLNGFMSAGGVVIYE